MIVARSVLFWGAICFIESTSNNIISKMNLMSTFWTLHFIYLLSYIKFLCPSLLGKRVISADMFLDALTITTLCYAMMTANYAAKSCVNGRTDLPTKRLHFAAAGFLFCTLVILFAKYQIYGKEIRINMEKTYWILSKLWVLALDVFFVPVFLENPLNPAYGEEQSNMESDYGFFLAFIPMFTSRWIFTIMVEPVEKYWVQSYLFIFFFLIGSFSVALFNEILRNVIEYYCFLDKVSKRHKTYWILLSLFELIIISELYYLRICTLYS